LVKRGVVFVTAAVCLLVLLLAADYILPHIPFIERYVENLTDDEDDEDI